MVGQTGQLGRGIHLLREQAPPEAKEHCQEGPRAQEGMEVVDGAPSATEESEGHYHPTGVPQSPIHSLRCALVGVEEVLCALLYESKGQVGGAVQSIGQVRAPQPVL